MKNRLNLFLISIAVYLSAVGMEHTFDAIIIAILGIIFFSLFDWAWKSNQEEYQILKACLKTINICIYIAVAGAVIYAIATHFGLFVAIMSQCLLAFVAIVFGLIAIAAIELFIKKRRGIL